MMLKRTRIDLGRTFARTSGRVADTFARTSGHVADTFKRPRFNSPRFNGKAKASATLVAAAAGIAGFYAAMRYVRRAHGPSATFDVYPNENGGWTVKTSGTFETRSQALDVARRATAAMRSEDWAATPFGDPDNSVRRPWSGPSSASATDS
jgi:hypothetical protein